MNRTDDRSSTIIVFDTDCVLCSAWVHFILRHERDQKIKFVSAWSNEGMSLAARHNLTVDDLDETYLVVEDGRGLVRSDAGLALLGHLSMPWRTLRILSIFPRSFRDIVYAFIARNRYRWFGHSENCFVPPQGQSHRFVNGARSAPRSPFQDKSSGRPE
ncbi:thiol-disulfide oxidoreductase DCC family protein [Rhizobium sp. BR 314]|uniref:thiol-disulfide oxidoreductase DCC family protein n=1 Tax=Rhizobium sp. BR 314 TaxID=3040013 RepID=UPI0039BF256C